MEHAAAAPSRAPASSETSTTPAAFREFDVAALASVLVLLQGAVGVLSALEVAAFGMLIGTPGTLLGSMALTGGLALLTLGLATGLRRRSRLARRVTLAVETLALLVALVDLGLSLALAHAFLDPMPALTRLALPIAVVVLLRRPTARAEFGARASRRQRRTS